MPLEDLTQIDITLNPDKDGKIGLVITDAGITTDPAERYNLFVQKVKAYVNCILNGQFDSMFPGLKPSDFFILLQSANPATPQMLNIKEVTPRGRPEDKIEIRFLVSPLEVAAEPRVEAPISEWLKTWVAYAIERAIFEMNSKNAAVYFSLKVHLDNHMDF